MATVKNLATAKVVEKLKEEVKYTYKESFFFGWWVREVFSQMTLKPDLYFEVDSFEDIDKYYVIERLTGKTKELK